MAESRVLMMVMQVNIEPKKERELGVRQWVTPKPDASKVSQRRSGWYTLTVSHTTTKAEGRRCVYCTLDAGWLITLNQLITRSHRYHDNLTHGKCGGYE